MNHHPQRFLNWGGAQPKDKAAIHISLLLSLFLFFSFICLFDFKQAPRFVQRIILLLSFK